MHLATVDEPARRTHPTTRPIRLLLVSMLCLGAMLGCDPAESWTYRGIPETEWRRLAAGTGGDAEEARGVLLRMDADDCRVALDGLLDTLGSGDAATRIAALDAIAEEPAYRRWFPTEIGRTLDARASAWGAPVGDARSESWSVWIRERPVSQRAEAAALVRAIAANPNTPLGMSGPDRVDAALRRGVPLVSTTMDRLTASR